MSGNRLTPILAGLLVLSSCEGFEFNPIPSGTRVSFSARTTENFTKASYSGDKDLASGTYYERIDWESGDLVRIYCEAASAPSAKYADYRVDGTTIKNSNQRESTAKIVDNDDDALSWGKGDHTFYSVYPSPKSDGITQSISAASVSASLAKSQNTLSSSLTSDGATPASYKVKPDLKWQMMVAKAGPYTSTTGIPKGDNIFLSYTPLTTAVQFIFTNGSDNDLHIEELSLLSAGTQISGAFTVDIDGKMSPDDGYAKVTPNHTGSAVTADEKTVVITLPEGGVDIKKGKTLTCTFFLAPTKTLDDLTLSVVYDKSSGKELSLRLGYSDGTGMQFPRCKKSFIRGLAVPDGVWVAITEDPDVVDWTTLMSSDDKNYFEIDFK